MHSTHLKPSQPHPKPLFAWPKTLLWKTDTMYINLWIKLCMTSFQHFNTMRLPQRTYYQLKAIYFVVVNVSCCTFSKLFSLCTLSGALHNSRWPRKQSAELISDRPLSEVFWCTPVPKSPSLDRLFSSSPPSSCCRTSSLRFGFFLFAS